MSMRTIKKHSFLSNTYRKYGTIVASCVTIVGALLMTFSKMAASNYMLFVGRAITGIATGILILLSPASTSSIIIIVTNIIVIITIFTIITVYPNC